MLWEIDIEKEEGGVTFTNIDGCKKTNMKYLYDSKSDHIFEQKVGR